jgi:hypothetical protein
MNTFPDFLSLIPSPPLFVFPCVHLCPPQSRTGKQRRGGDVHALHDKQGPGAGGDKGAGGQQQGRPPRGPVLGPKHGFYGSSLPKRWVG